MMQSVHEDWGVLLCAANKGDENAYLEFFQRISPVLRGIVWAKSAGLGPAACEDILQDILLAIHLKRNTWRPEAPLRPWLFAIARYKIVDAFRARGSKVNVPIDDFALDLMAPDAVDPTEAADMAKLIGMLDKRSAIIVRQIGIEGANITETAQSLNLSEGAVRVALHRALKQLAVLRERHIK
jgi:RNA polymerase sigma factor (sigma-70 family)